MPKPVSPIRWQVLYKDGNGKIIRESAFSSTNPAEDLMPVDTGPTSVLDIIIHVTIKDGIETKPITTEAEAEKASGEPTKADAKEGDVDGKHKDHSYKVKKVNSTVMVIRSKALVKALRAVVKYYPEQAVTGDEITVDEPYYFVLHHMEELEQYMDETDRMTLGPNTEIKDLPSVGTLDPTESQAAKSQTNELRRDYRVLKSYLDAKWEKKIERELERYKQNPPVATHEMLWILFRPGVKVFAGRHNPLLAGGWIVRYIKEYSDGGYELSLWSLDFEGKCQQLNNGQG